MELSRGYYIAENQTTNLEYMEALQWALEHELVFFEGEFVMAYDKHLLQIHFNAFDFTEIRFNSAGFYLATSEESYSGWGPGDAYPSGYDPELHPVCFVTWYGAACYCDWLSMMNGFEPFYEGNWLSTPDHNPYEATGFRLPTEAEWERAARYPDGRIYPWGNTSPTCDLANFCISEYCVGWTRPVSSYPDGASHLGLFDLAGNLIDWVHDASASYPEEYLLDPYGAEFANYRIRRGGNWTSRLSAQHLKTTRRLPGLADTHEGDPPFSGGSGFRIALSGEVEASEFVYVPAGTFHMGSLDEAQPVHQVTLTNDFLIGRYEVSNEEFVEALNWAHDNDWIFLEDGWVRAWGENLVRYDLEGYDFNEIRYNPGSQDFQLAAGTGWYANWGPGIAWPDGYDPANHPANYMTWYGAAAYCDWRSMMEGIEPYYLGNWNPTADHNPYEAEGWRLPTEAEWEYTARYNDGRAFPWGNAAADCELANCRPSYPDYCLGWTAPVDSRPAGLNALEIHHLAGNINEWVNDWYAEYPDEDVVDPVGALVGLDRILRGGSWASRDEAGQPHELRSAHRRAEDPHHDTGSPWFAGSFGLRLCRTVNPVTDVAGQGEIAREIDLLQNYPNPFNPTTTLRFDLDRAAEARIEVFNLAGQLVDVVFDGFAHAGRNRVVFDAADLPAGMYVWVLKTEDRKDSSKMLLKR